MASVVPHADVTVDADDVFKTLKEILTLIRPHWDLNNVKTEDKSNGYCNRNMRVYVEGKLEEDFLIRVVNDKIPNLLATTTTILKFLQTTGLSPPLLCTMSNGLCMGYIHGEAITWDDTNVVRREPHWSNIAGEMARYHAVSSERALAAGVRSVQTGVTDDMVATVRSIYDSGILPESARARLPTVEDIVVGKETLTKRLQNLKAEVSFIHFDVNPTNIILTNETDSSVRFVDYECCSVGASVLDIAWFFTTFVQNPSLSSSLAHYPSEAEQRTFVRAYLCTRASLRGEPGPVSETQVQHILFLLKTARLCVCLRLVAACVMLLLMSERTKRENAHKPKWQDDDWLAYVLWGFYEKNFDALINEKFVE